MLNSEIWLEDKVTEAARKALRFRHEDKYLCSDGELVMLQVRLDAVMQHDSHVNGKGTYDIRSVYFDDIDDGCWRANDDGVNGRSKWRIRIYNCDTSVVFLEEKRKDNGMIHKDQCRISWELAQKLILGGIPEGGRDGVPAPSRELPRLLNRFLYLRAENLYHPVVMTTYERRPYVFGPGNVRVTFDRNISASVDYGHFADENLAVMPIMPTGMQLLEVKYDEFLPDVLQHTIQMGSMRRQTFSKYYLCREFLMQ